MEHSIKEQVDAIVARYPAEESSLVQVLQDVNQECGYLPAEALELVARKLKVRLAKVYGVATFYKAFSLEPRGQRTVKICTGTACHVRGAQGLRDEAERVLGVAAGGTTTDRRFTLETVNCVGACGMAPVVVVDDQYHRSVKIEELRDLLTSDPPAPAGPKPTEVAEALPPQFDSTTALRDRGAKLAAARQQLKRRILVCAGTGCVAAGSLEVFERLKATCRAQGLPLTAALTDCLDVAEQHDGSSHLFRSGCHGFCEKGPLLHILPDDILYTGVAVKDVDEIVTETLIGGRLVEKKLLRDPVSRQRVAGRDQLPFYAKQTRIALAHCGLIDPEQLDDYLAVGGFLALGRVLDELTPEQVIDQIEAAGLRGRGGAGFPTGRKWRSCRKATGAPKYVICNGDEGDPGAFMDRSIMEGDPFGVIEGMLIGAWAVGSCEGYIYVRNEYPLAVQRLEKAIAACRAAGLLGDRILGREFSFNLRISRGGGAFVCGESSALMRSLEGKVGEPRAKYVHGTERGLYDRPTVLNNVETWICVPRIIEQGASWFASIGTTGSKGTKVFSLVGKVRNTGLVEVPMGTTLREIVYGPGGGIIDDQPFKAVQTGGPSGGCLPATKLDLPIDFEELTRAGSMMGSGGLIVMDHRTCMVDIARYFIHFLLEESCGKCVPCREGLRQLHFLLEEIVAGRGTPDHLALIEELARGVQEASLCALGQSSANPVLSTLTYFRDEYRAHIEEHRCPAGICRALISFSVKAEACTGCTRCAKVCPTGAAQGEKKEVHRIEQALCIQCGACYDACRFSAIEIR